MKKVVRKKKTVVVPLDFSKESINGLRLAMVVAESIKANICLVYVQKKKSEFYSLSLTEENNWAKQRFEEIIEKFQPRLKSGKIEYKIRKGRIYEEIVNQAKYLDASFIVSATHGSSGFEEFFIGSNAGKIVGASECPVFTIRKDTCPKTINRIVIPIDCSLETRQKVPLTCELAKAFKAEIHVLIVLNKGHDAEFKKKLKAYSDQTCSYIKDLKIPLVRATVNHSNIASGTIEYATKVKASLISIMTEQELSFSNLILGPYAQQLVNHSSIPVLSIHPNKKYIDAAGI
ncbi:MAG: universal stress protein [Bacteroidota bacterium]